MDVHKSHILFVDRSPIKVGKAKSQLIRHQSAHKKKKWPKYDRAKFFLKDEKHFRVKTPGPHKYSTLKGPYLTG
jgi:hypothetical protein